MYFHFVYTHRSANKVIIYKLHHIIVIIHKQLLYLTYYFQFHNNNVISDCIYGV
jgi:hypothetical protein